jgi:cytochrome c556
MSKEERVWENIFSFEADLQKLKRDVTQMIRDKVSQPERQKFVDEAMRQLSAKYRRKLHN